MTTIGVILAGGIGSRMNLPTPKQYLCINGKEVLSYSIDIFKSVDLIEDIIVVTDSNEHVQYVHDKYNVNSILGGDTRNISFYNALEFIKKTYPSCEKIIVNEAARPLITKSVVVDYINLLDQYDLVYCTKGITDSLETINGEYANRSEYRLVMSPEGYRYEVIVKYFDKNSQTTFPGHCVPTSHSRFGYTKYVNNIKLTYQNDLDIISRLL